MTYAELYKQCKGLISYPSADFDLSQLFRAHFGRVIHNIDPKDIIEKDDAFIFVQKVKRMAGGYPLQYLIGEWEFYSITLKVGEGVLIPRPDTETIVDVALGILKEKKNPTVLDLCSGSGAIAIAIAENKEDSQVFAVEYSKQAIEYLEYNIANSKASERLTLIEDDALTTLEQYNLPLFDMVVSNPPYLTKQELLEVPTEVSYEPKMALDGGEDGLTFYKEIAVNAKTLLKEDGYLVFEVGYEQAEVVSKILSFLGYSDILATKDLNGIERCVVGRYIAPKVQPQVNKEQQKEEVTISFGTE